MSPNLTAISITLAIVLFGSLLGFLAGRGRARSLEEWAVAGRSFGLLFMWLLMAGEVYSTFAFLGAAGWAYSRGAPAIYIMAYLTLGYVISFFLLPPIWQLGRDHGLQTHSDFFQHRYQTNTLAVLVSITGVVFLIPYLQLQLTGLGIIVQVASFDVVSRTTSIVVAVLLVAAFVIIGGMRSVAWVSILKDLLMILAALTVGLYLPIHLFGSTSTIFHAILAAKPHHLTMPGSTTAFTHSWFISTVLLSACGFYMWPHIFGAAFSAKSGDILRRNAIIMPLYTLSLVLIFLAGFTALLVVPGLSNGDLSLLMLARHSLPPWFLGVIGGAGALTAMVPAAIIILTASTLFAKNVCRPLFSPDMSEEKIARLARITVFALSLISAWLALHSSQTLVSLLLIGYAGVTQFFPGVVLGLAWRRTGTLAVTIGLIAGITIVAALMLTKHDPYHGLNAGFLALCANFAVTVLLSLASPEGTVLTAPKALPKKMRREL